MLPPQGLDRKRARVFEDASLVPSEAGGVAERCKHRGCSNELWACCTECLQQLCHVHFGASRCHEHGGAGICECQECKSSTWSNTSSSFQGPELPCAREASAPDSFLVGHSQFEEDADHPGLVVEEPVATGTPHKDQGGGEGNGQGNKQNKKATRIRHHTLRLGLTAECYHAMQRRAPFALTADKLAEWMESAKMVRRFPCGNGFKPAKPGKRLAASNEPPTALELIYRTPEQEVSLAAKDFLYGYDFESAVTDWIETYLSKGHAFQNGGEGVEPDGEHLKVNHYMIGPQLDVSGCGMHYQLITQISSRWDHNAARAWTDQLERCFKQHYLGVEPSSLGGYLSKTTQVKPTNSMQHAGYACHAHEAPWSVRRKGKFESSSPREFFQMFLKWQETVHKKLHVASVEVDYENMRSGAGDLIVPDDVELCARDIEDLINTADLHLNDGGVEETYAAIGRCLYNKKKRGGLSWPRFPKTKKDIIVQIVASRRTNCQPAQILCACVSVVYNVLARSQLKSTSSDLGIYPLSSFNNVPEEIQRLQVCMRYILNVVDL